MALALHGIRGVYNMSVMVLALHGIRGVSNLVAFIEVHNVHTARQRTSSFTVLRTVSLHTTARCHQHRFPCNIDALTGHDVITSCFLNQLKSVNYHLHKVVYEKT